MTPQERKEFEDLKKLVKDMQLGRNLINTESLKRQVFEDIISAGVLNTATTSDTNVTIPATPATVARQYNHKVRVTIDGADYYIGLYNV